jgi:hypothetical protein
MKRWCVSLLLILGTLSFPYVPPAPAAPPASPADRIASNLGLLLTLHGEEGRVAPGSSLGREVARIQAQDAIEVLARFARELTPAERRELEAMGVEFRRVAGRPAHLDRFYGLLVPVHAVDDLAAYPLAVWLEAAWHPVVPAPLDWSIPAINVTPVWQVSDNWVSMLTLTGEGVTIANFDTGVDVHHPGFLDATFSFGPDDCNWDSDNNGVFTPGVDTFPLVPPPGVLRYWDAAGDPNNTPGAFEPTQDWVYLDGNGDGIYQTSETVYMAHDADGDGVLEAGECLRSRGNFGTGIPTSKIAAVLDAGGVQRTRGTDLELTSGDTNGHGTGVAGILVAGNSIHCAGLSCMYVYPDTRRYTGVAPDADLIVADRYNNSAATYISWATAQGAEVMLYEYGAWVYTYLDGSSNHEQIMDTASASGAVQVVPTGNAHGGGRHLQYNLPSGASSYTFNVPSVSATQIYGSMTWLSPSNNLGVAIETPAGISSTLPCSLAGSGWLSVSIGSHTCWCERAVDSGRGTALYNVWIEQGGSPVSTGNWKMYVYNPAASAERTNFYIADDVTTWSGGVAWVNSGAGVEAHTATWPSTCDSCIGVASYATRGYVDGTTPGAISPFSGRGPRFFDNALVVDVAAPGHYDVVSTASKDSTWGGPTGLLGKYTCGSPAPTQGCFGGTSAAGPHAAGVAALLVQFLDHQVDAAEVQDAIRRGARSDGFTGTTPNPTWGYGKLDAYAALEHLMHDLGDASDATNSYGMSMQAYPGVVAHFPTVYTSTIPSDPPGPLHRRAGSLATGPLDACLGTSVSAESEADRGFDEDANWPNGGASQNISPTVDTANGEGWSDDGLTLPFTPLPHCQPTNLSYGVTLAGGNVGTHYVNMWIDWNRDGDWGDVFTCTTPADTPEWVVQDQWVPYTAPGFYTLNTPTFLPYQPGDPYDATWIRLTLSEQVAPLDPNTGRADGRGPAAGYDYGETEDIFLWYPPMAGFQVATNTVCVSDTVHFTNTSYGSPPITYTWDFGDGSRLVTTSFTHPTHHYTAAGGYPVVLTATAYAGGLPIFTRHQIFLNVNPSPTAGFVSPVIVPVGVPAAFTNTSAGATSYLWDFGDGVGTSTDVHPSYVYTRSGTYTVSLAAYNDLGCDDVHRETLQVSHLLYLPLVLRND